MSDIILRPYQQKFIDDIRAEFNLNHKRVVGVAPCGSGKTIMTGWMIRESLNRGKRSIFFVHRHELIEQTADTFTRLDIPHGIISSGFRSQYDLPVQIASVQTLAKRLDKIPAPHFLICDECHHILANTYRKILDKFPNAYLLGVTATPQRMGGKTLNDVFDSMVQSLSVNQLIKLGNLSTFKYFAADLDIDLTRVHIVGGDYDSDQLQSIMNNKKITGDIVNHYINFANDKSAICYCVNVKHSKSVADAFISIGISAAHVDGDTPKIIRAKLVEDFRQGNIKVLCNAELFGEGFDVPKCQAVILARPTQSLTLFIQQAMRAMRPDPDDPDKVAVIIDCVQNYSRHGMPNDFRAWSLDPNIEKIFRCPDCDEVIVPIVKKVDGKLRKQCPHCGCIFPLGKNPESGGRQAKYRLGELEELAVSFDDYISYDSVIRKPTTPEDFLRIAEEKKYKRGWVAFRALEFANSYDDCLHIADICGYNKGWAWHKWNEIISAHVLLNAPLMC